MSIQEATADTFSQIIEESSTPVVVDIYTPSCSTCQKMEPIFKDVAEELHDSYTFIKVDASSAQEIAQNYNVTSVPTFLFIKDGDVHGRETGYMDKETLQSTISQHLG